LTSASLIGKLRDDPLVKRARLLPFCPASPGPQRDERWRWRQGALGIDLRNHSRIGRGGFLEVRARLLLEQTFLQQLLGILGRFGRGLGGGNVDGKGTPPIAKRPWRCSAA
jgi:hypothetical protein